MRSLYYFTYDSAFHHVRNGTLDLAAAWELAHPGTEKIATQKIHQSFEVPNGSILAFNRFGTSAFFRFAARRAEALGIPIMIDIDDLFWELPSFSKDPANCEPGYLEKVDSLVATASVITTTTEELLEALRNRYPSKKIFVVPNAIPNWIAPPGAALIANTDTFKMGSEDLSWYRVVLRNLRDAGVPLQFLGGSSSENFQDELQSYVLPQRGYAEYLQFLRQGNFRVGIVPVSNSAYANSKSDIKLQEYVAAGIPVLASKILPYENFLKQFPDADVRLVENSEFAWKKALQSFSAQSDKFVDLRNSDSRPRLDQYAAWQAVFEYFESFERPTPGAYKQFSFFLKCYLHHFASSLSLLRNGGRQLKAVLQRCRR